MASKCLCCMYAWIECWDLTLFDYFFYDGIGVNVNCEDNEGDVPSSIFQCIDRQLVFKFLCVVCMMFCLRIYSFGWLLTLIDSIVFVEQNMLFNVIVVILKIVTI